jgi:MFS family permease
MPIFAEREKKARTGNTAAAVTENKSITFEALPQAPDLTPAERQEGQKRMINEGALWAVMNSAIVPGGAVLTAFALYMGADVFVIGLVTALPLLAAILQLWTPQFVNLMGGRKAVSVLTLGTARWSVIPLAIISMGAWFYPHLAALWLILFLVQLTVFSGLTAVGGTSWLSWATTVVPIEKRAVYFARRSTVVGIVGLVTALLTGFFLDWWTEPAATATGHRTNPGAYVVLFAIAALAGVLSTGQLKRTPDLNNQAAPPDRPSFKESLIATWQMVALRKYLIFRSANLFAIGIVLPYYAVYMLQNLKLSFTELFFLQNVGALAGLVVFPLWGRLLDKYGCSPILYWTSWFKVAYVILWAFVVPGNPFWPLLFLHMSLAMDSGLNLAAGNLLMNLLPPGTRNVGYISVFTAITSLVTAIGPFMAGIVIGWIASASLPVLGSGMGAIQLMFLLSGVLRAFSMLFYRGFSDKVRS